MKKVLIGFSLLLSIVVVGWIYLTYRFQEVYSTQEKIGVSYMTLNNEFYQMVNSEIEKVVALSGDKLYLRDPALNIDKQVQQIEYFMDEKVDAIILNPVQSDHALLLKTLKRAKKQGIKLIVVDNQLSDSSVADSTIQSDNYQAGLLLSQELKRQKSSANILVLEHPNVLSTKERLRGFKDGLGDDKGYHIISEQNGLGQTEVSMPLVSKVMKEGVTFDTIMAINDRSAIGALAAVKKSGKSDVGIYSVDGSPDIKELLATEPLVKASVYQSPMTMGAKAIATTYDLLNGKSVDKDIKVGVGLVTRTNLDQYPVGWQ